MHWRHQFKEQEMGSVGDMSKVCSKIALKCLYLARIGRPDIFMVCEQTCSCHHKIDQSLWQTIISFHLLHSFITQVSLDNIVTRNTLHNNAGWDCFGNLTLPEILKTQNQHQSEMLCTFGSHTCVPMSWMCKKQTSVSHSSTESEIISLVAGLRMDGSPALDLWDLVIEVLHSSSNLSKKSKENVQGNLLHDTPSSKQAKNQVNTPIQHNDLELCNVDNVSSNVKSSHIEAMLYIFEDNEAVIKMIIKGKSPTLRHVSWTHRVALDWLFDRINLNPNIHVKYVDTKYQLANVLTKGNFTRDEWNNLLHLFNISIFSSAKCLRTMSKRMQQGKGEEGVVAKSKPALNLVLHSAASHLKKYSNTVQYGNFRTRRGSCLSTTPSSSFTSRSTTPSRQEIEHPTSSSSSSTSPTMTSSTVSSESVARQEREDPCGMDPCPAAVSSKHVDKQERGDPCSSEISEWRLWTKPTKNPKPNKNVDRDQERGDPCHSDIPEWLQEFRENLVDDRVLEHGDSHASSSHEPSLEPALTRSADLE